MPHADASVLPPEIGDSKPAFYDYLVGSLTSLLEGQNNWVVNLSNTASLVYSAFEAWDAGKGRGVNWVGFYLVPHLFPGPPSRAPNLNAVVERPSQLLLAPFCGRPACQLVKLPALPAGASAYAFPIPKAGVCATAYLLRRTQLVQDVEAFPCHIACDAGTKSEIVVPLVVGAQDGRPERAVGVFDLDCTLLAGFDEDDRAGLERIAQVVVSSCEWW